MRLFQTAAPIMFPKVLGGNGDGNLQAAVNYAVGTSPSAVQIGDFNGDGKLDLIVTNQESSSISVLLGNGDKTFQAQKTTNLPSGSYPSAFAVGDFNGDKNLDIGVLISVPAYRALMRSQCCSVTETEAFRLRSITVQGTNSSAIQTGDFNGDGKTDLVTLNFDNGGQVSVYPGNGDGTFQSAVNTLVTAAFSTMVVADFNRDGFADVAVQGFILLGNGDGTFQTPTPSVLGPVSAAGDFNGDGIIDLASSNGNTTTV